MYKIFNKFYNCIIFSKFFGCSYLATFPSYVSLFNWGIVAMWLRKYDYIRLVKKSLMIHELMWLSGWSILPCVFFNLWNFWNQLIVRLHMLFYIKSKRKNINATAYNFFRKASLLIQSKRFFVRWQHDCSLILCWKLWDKLWNYLRCFLLWYEPIDSWTIMVFP